MEIVIPEGMGDSAMLALIVGFLSPIVLNFIIKATWPSWAKSLVAFAWSAVIGVLTALVAGAFTGLSIVSTILLVFVMTITTYQLFWRQVAPNMQRGAAEKRALVAAEQRSEIAEVAAPVAESVARRVSNG